MKNFYTFRDLVFHLEKFKNPEEMKKYYYLTTLDFHGVAKNSRYYARAYIIIHIDETFFVHRVKIDGFLKENQPFFKIQSQALWVFSINNTYPTLNECETLAEMWEADAKSYEDLSNNQFQYLSTFIHTYPDSVFFDILKIPENLKDRLGELLNKFVSYSETPNGKTVGEIQSWEM